MSESIDRPGGVTLVAVLAWISGLLDIFGGTLLLFQTSVASTVEQFGGASALIASAIVSILIGAIVIIVATMLLRGSSIARMIVTVFEMLSIAARSSSRSRIRPARSPSTSASRSRWSCSSCSGPAARARSSRD